MLMWPTIQVRDYSWIVQDDRPSLILTDHMLVAAESYFKEVTPTLRDCPTADVGSNKAIFFSSVTGQAVKPQKVRSAWYWVANAINPVQFSASLTATIPDLQREDGSITFLEIGPHPTLTGLVNQITRHPDVGIQNAECFSVMKAGHSASETFDRTMKALADRNLSVELTR